MKVRHNSSRLFTITRFRDGDTLEGFLQCRHCSSTSAEVIRLPGIDSWEPNGPERAKALALAKMLTDIFKGSRYPLLGGAIRRDKYSRIIADLELEHQTMTQFLLGQHYAWHGVNSAEPPDFPRG